MDGNAYDISPGEAMPEPNLREGDGIQPISGLVQLAFLELCLNAIRLSTPERCFPIRDDVHLLVYGRRGGFHHQESFTISSYIQSG